MSSKTSHAQPRSAAGDRAASSARRSTESKVDNPTENVPAPAGEGPDSGGQRGRTPWILAILCFFVPAFLMVLYELLSKPGQ